LLQEQLNILPTYNSIARVALWGMLSMTGDILLTDGMVIDDCLSLPHGENHRHEKT